MVSQGLHRSRSGLLNDFPGSSVGKESTCNAGDTGDEGSIPGWGRSPGEGNDNPFQLFHSIFLPGASQGQRSLAGYIPWGCKRSDMTHGTSND